MSVCSQTTALWPQAPFAFPWPAYQQSLPAAAGLTKPPTEIAMMPAANTPATLRFNLYLILYSFLSCLDSDAESRRPLPRSPVRAKQIVVGYGLSPRSTAGGPSRTGPAGATQFRRQSRRRVTQILASTGFLSVKPTRSLTLEHTRDKPGGRRPCADPCEHGHAGPRCASLLVYSH